MSLPSANEEELFAAAVVLSPTEREAYLARVCAGDPGRRTRLEALLRSHEEARSFMESPPEAALAYAVTRQAPRPEAAAGDQIGRYKLLQVIGEGGCGVVYMAEQEEPVRRRVALKIIKLGMDTKSVIARFEAERQAVAMMDHPNIAKVLDAGATGLGRPYFVMELVRGVRITDYCDQNNLSTTERLQLFIQVCHAIQHAHQKGIIHRDIKPSNILVTLHDGVPVPKVIDFGIAKATQGRLTDQTLFTAFEQFIGTPAYMSPEQAEMSGLDIDTRSDIYSLGVLLYELVTGRPPFDPQTFLKTGLDEMRRIIREVDPPRPSTRLSTLTEADMTTVAKLRGTGSAQLSTLLSGDLDWIIMKALEKNRGRRYDTAAALAADIQRYLRNEPVVARPPSTSYLVQKLVRRHRLAFAAGGLIAAALIAGLGVSTWAFIQERAARERAVAAELEQKAQRQGAEAARKRAVAAEREQSRLRELAEAARNQEQATRLAQEENLYAMNMNLAMQALESRIVDLADAHARLASTRPVPGGRDLRGFEWRYLWLRSQGDELAQLPGHHQVVDATIFSPAGTLLATHSMDGVLKLWAPGSLGEPQTMSDVAAITGFTDDGRSLFFTRPDRSLWRIDLASRQPEKMLDSPGHLLGIRPDGRAVVVLGAGLKPVIRNLEDSAPPMVREDTAPDTLAVMSRDGSRMALSGRSFDGIQVFDLGSQREVARFHDPRPVIAMALSTDGSRLVSASFDGVIKVRAAGRPDPVASFKAFVDPINSLAFSPDGKSLAAGGCDRQVKLWTTADWREQLTLSGHDGTIDCVAFSPDGQRLVSGGDDEKVLLWSTAPPARPPAEAPRLLRGQSYADRTPDLGFSPDSRLFTGTAADGTVKVWRTSSLDCVATFPVEARTVSFAADGRHVLSESFDGTVQQWSLEGPEPAQRLQSAPSAGDWQLASLSAQARVSWMSSGSNAARICSLCEISNGRDYFNLGTSITCSTLAVAPAGDLMYVGQLDGSVEVWDVEHQHQRLHFPAHKLAVTALAVSPDGRYLATGGLDNQTQLWDAATGEHLATFLVHNRPVWALAFSPDGRTLASGSCDKSVILCSVPLRRFLTQIKFYNGQPQGYEQEVRRLRFSPDGNLLTAILGDGTLRFLHAAPLSVTDAPDRSF
jgi:WD40 repeat protein/serine/threonine protein kinase